VTEQLKITEEFLESLTIDDIEALEDAVGIPIDHLFNPAKPAEVPKAQMFKALAFVVRRRDDPGFTLEQAGKLTLAELGRLVDAVGGAAPVPLPGGST